MRTITFLSGTTFNMEISPHLLLCVLLQRLTARMSGVSCLYEATPPHFVCMYVAFPHVVCSLHVYTGLCFDVYTLKLKGAEGRHVRVVRDTIALFA